MQELELETAELLPARETSALLGPRASRRSHSVTNVVGNTSQAGRLLNVSAFNGDGNSLNILGSVAPARLARRPAVHFLRGLHGR